LHHERSGTVRQGEGDTYLLLLMLIMLLLLRWWRVLPLDATGQLL
jgi:hypothetical protein